MVSLVLVSHSRALADSVANLARQVAPPGVRIAIAAGAGASRNEFGTDALEIRDAVQSLDSADGVLILMDLGSAVMNAEMALELLPEDMRSRVRLCPAPLVEGAISAVVQAGLGSELSVVYSAAMESLHPKRQQLAAEPVTQPSMEDSVRQAGEETIPFRPVSITLTLINPHGLHARPAARFVKTAAGYDARITVVKAGSGAVGVPATSLNSLATLGAQQGDQIHLHAEGKEASTALEALRQLVEEGFGEVESPTRKVTAGVQAKTTADTSLASFTAIPISPGIALGPLIRLHYSTANLDASHSSTRDPQREWERLERAIETARKMISEYRNAVLKSSGASEAAIFEAHELILVDSAFQTGLRHHVFEEHASAAFALQRVIEELASQYRSLSDPYMQQRATDVLDVGTQVGLALGSIQQSSQTTQPGVLLAVDFTPRQVIELDTSTTYGLVCGAGSLTSHAAILARALSIPTVGGVGARLDHMPEGMLLGIDGSTGEVWIDPPAQVQQELRLRREAWLEHQKRLRDASYDLTRTHDGQRVEVAANLSGVIDARVAVANGAEAVGVLRTEFLYLTRTTAPSEDEQITALQEIARLMQGRTVIVRTLDVGGDKPIPYLPLPHEDNPYLGVRAIRQSLHEPWIFTTQIRAILRAAADHELRILLPMISVTEELSQARLLIQKAHQDLVQARIQHGWPVQIGIMVETPSAALLTSHLASQADFFSIGTNDLTQYTLAAERGNTRVAYLSDALHPSVLHLIREVVDVAHQHGKWAGVCGEIASDPLAIPVLIGLGVDELSMNVAQIPLIKSIIRNIDTGLARTLAHKALLAASSDEVRHLAKDWAEQYAPGISIA